MAFKCSPIMSAMRAAALVVALCGCGFTPQSASDAANGGSNDGGPRDAPADTTTSNWLTGYHYRKSITVTAASELISPEVDDIAAVKITATIRPTTPTGR